MKLLIFFLFLPLTLFPSSELQNIRAVIFDMDGVLRKGFEKITGADELITWMTEHHMPGMILTNECRYTETQLREDLDEMGIVIPPDWEIYTSAHAIRDFFQRKHSPLGGRTYVYVVGESGLRDALAEVQKDNFHIRSRFPHKRKDNDSLYVVFGSVDQIQIHDLENAIQWISEGAKVITTCPDNADPSAKGGQLVGMPSQLVHMIKRNAPCNAYSPGKPNPMMTQDAIHRLQSKYPTLQPSEILFVGDTIDTDIRAAFEGGLPSALVLSGNTREKGLRNHVIEADYVFPSVAEVKAAFEKTFPDKVFR